MASIHKHYYVSASPAKVGETITVTALDKSERLARATQVNPNGDMIVDFLDTEKVERVWVATVEKLPTPQEHQAALEAEQKAFEARLAIELRKAGPASPEITQLRGEIAELKAAIAALTAKAKKT